MVNALFPPVADDSDSEDPDVSLWMRRRRINERELERLAAHWTGPTAELPLLAIDSGPRLVDVLGHHLEWAEA